MVPYNRCALLLLDVVVTIKLCLVGGIFVQTLFRSVLLFFEFAVLGFFPVIFFVL